MVRNLCIASDDALYLYRNARKISHSVSELHVLSWCHLYIKICKGACFRKNVVGVMVRFLLTLSDHVLYMFLYKVLSKHLIGFQSYGLEQ